MFGWPQSAFRHGNRSQRRRGSGDQQRDSWAYSDLIVRNLTVNGTCTGCGGGGGGPSAWDTSLGLGGTGTAAQGRTALGATTVGSNFFTLANPGAVSFPEISAGNAVSAVSAATLRTDLGLVVGTNVQAFDADLTTWSGVTPTAGIQTWLATPNSANLRGALTDENGTGAALFSGATTPDFTTGFTIGGAAASGKVLVG